MSRNIKKVFTLVFIIIELFLYFNILTGIGLETNIASFSAIVICLLYSFTNLNLENRYTIAGLIMTVCADLFLVIIEPRHQLYGMMFFFVTQLMYFIKLNSLSKNKMIFGVRIILIIIVELIGYLVLKDNMDLLAIISLLYYVMLFMNILEAFIPNKNKKLFGIALILFILCDTVIGLQCMTDAYLPISENSIIYKIINVNFNLAWMFYLPSQVLIALTTFIYNKNYEGDIK